MSLSIILLCTVALYTVVNGIPSTHQPTCGSKVVTVDKGGFLRLTCGSICSEANEVFTWWKVTEEDKRLELSISEAVVKEDGVSAENGGEYQCKCGTRGQICIFYVAVLPEVTFTTSHMATHYGGGGNEVVLTCTAEGFPANYTTITNAYGIPMDKQVKRMISSFHLETTAIILDIDEEDYVCEVVTYYKGHLISNKKESLQIKLYSPPSIMYTTEFVLHREEDFGELGHVSCVIHTSSDAESHVTWWSGGDKLVHGGKYQMKSSAISETVTEFRLELERVEQEDVKSYLCQLSTQYNSEETQETWIKMDYRKEATVVGIDGGTLSGGERNGVRGGSSQLSAGSLHSLAVVVCLMIVAGLGTWGIVVRRRQLSRKKEESWIIGTERNSSFSLNSSPANSRISSPSVIKRK